LPLKPFFFTALEINYIQNTEYSFARGSYVSVFPGMPWNSN
jgi:hypothetical protein